MDKKADNVKQEHRFSKAAMKVAKRSLKEFEFRSDEAFLIRAKIDREWGS